MYILEHDESYHRWEDGRSNYAWDLGTLNSQMYEYSNLGKNLSDYDVYGRDIFLPMRYIPKFLVLSKVYLEVMKSVFFCPVDL